MSEGRRALNLSSWIDRILIGLVAFVFYWGGRQVEEFGKKVDNLSTTMASMVVELKYTSQETRDVKTEFHKHLDDVRDKKVPR